MVFCGSEEVPRTCTQATVAGQKLVTVRERQDTYRFFGLFNTGIDGTTTRIKIDKRVDLIFTNYLDILAWCEFLRACSACRARHGLDFGLSTMKVRGGRSAKSLDPNKTQ